MRLISIVEVDRSFKEVVVDQGRIVSRHRSFYNAQCAVERHLRSGRIGNNYEIMTLAEAKSRGLIRYEK